MFRVSSCLFVLLASQHATGLKVSARAGTWAAPDLQAVAGILDHIVSLHMTPENQALAKKVSADIKADIAVVVNTKNMTKEARRAKVASAIKEIEGLQSSLEKSRPNVTALKDKIDQETAELNAKKKELAMDEKEIKVMKLKKALVEKKLQLQNLIEAKMKSQQSKESLAADAKLQGDLVSSLSQATEKNALSGALTMLKARQTKLTEELSKMEADDKKLESRLATLSKDKSMVKKLKKEEHRKFEKARGLKRSELAEIDSAIKSINSGDLKGLETVMKKMKSDVKALDAKTGGFLY